MAEGAGTADSTVNDGVKDAKDAEDNEAAGAAEPAVPAQPAADRARGGAARSQPLKMSPPIPM